MCFGIFYDKLKYLQNNSFLNKKKSSTVLRQIYNKSFQLLHNKIKATVLLLPLHKFVLAWRWFKDCMFMFNIYVCLIRFCSDISQIFHIFY